MTLVLKTLKAAKSKVIDPKVFLLLMIAPLVSSEPEEVLFWSGRFEHHLHDRNVPESLLPRGGLLYCISNCGERWPMDHV